MVEKVSRLNQNKIRNEIKAESGKHPRPFKQQFNFIILSQFEAYEG